MTSHSTACPIHDDVIKWKHFPRSPVNSPHKGQWRGALVFSLICTRINGWVNNVEAGDLRRHRAHYDVTVMWQHGMCLYSVSVGSVQHQVVTCPLRHKSTTTGRVFGRKIYDIHFQTVYYFIEYTLNYNLALICATNQIITISTECWLGYTYLQAASLRLRNKGFWNCIYTHYKDGS